MHTRQQWREFFCNTFDDRQFCYKSVFKDHFLRHRSIVTNSGLAIKIEE
jgi:hypothetical protein